MRPQPTERRPAMAVLSAALLVALLAALLATSTTNAPHPPAARADVVVRNARIYTVDAARSWAEALAIADGRLVFVGGESDAGSWVGADTRVLDAGGRLILPAFHDTHTHLGSEADIADWCDAGYPDTLEDTVRALARCSAESAGRDWVLVHGGNESVVPAAGPPFGLLDSIESERPMLYQMAGQHEVWVNGVVLRLMGVDESTPDPDGGAFVRDAAGRLTGSVRGAEMPLAYEHVPWPDEQETAERYRDWLRRLPSYGIASIQEITELFDEWALVLEDWPDRGVRVRLAQRLIGYGEQGTRPEERVAEAAARAARFASSHLNAGSVKLFVDGTFGAQTAALHEPYILAERPGWPGEPYFTQDELNDWAQHVDAAGLQLHFHAIGDRAVHMALRACAVQHAASAGCAGAGAQRADASLP
jgi:predicted amidohydrolase YtcJ